MQVHNISQDCGTLLRASYPGANVSNLACGTPPQGKALCAAVGFRPGAGYAATLDEVIDHYAAGGRTIADGPNIGEGYASPLKSTLIAGFTISPGEREDLKAFLESLTNETFLHHPALAAPAQ